MLSTNFACVDECICWDLTKTVKTSIPNVQTKTTPLIWHANFRKSCDLQTFANILIALVFFAG